MKNSNINLTSMADNVKSNLDELKFVVKEIKL